MLRAPLNRFKRRLSAAALEDLSVPANRRRAALHFMFFDHGILRVLWHNFAEIAPGVFRSNHPSPRRLAQYAQRGIKTILNLRGVARDPHYVFEVEACRILGLKMVELPLTAREAPPRADLIAVVDAMRSEAKPFLIHCKSGADRTSLAAAMYLLIFHGATVAEARKEFSIRYIHFKWTRTGVLDHILDQYEAAQTQTGIGFEDWLRSDYDAGAIQASYDALRKGIPS